MKRSTWWFLALAYGISWTVSEVGFRLFSQEKYAGVAIALAFMFGPALAAVLVVRFHLRRSLRTLGPIFALNRYAVIAVAISVTFALAHVLVSPLLPGLTMNLGADALQVRILEMVPPAQHAEVGPALARFGSALPWILLAQTVLAGVAAGISINAVATFGEELGWRGFLHHDLAAMPFWRKSALIGVVWGLWHAPLILRGHNFPEHPAWGVLLMIAFCVALAPLFEFVRQRSGALLAPIWMHGVLNATAGSMVFVSGSDLIRGPTGAAGILVLLAMNLVLWRHLRRPATPIARLGLHGLLDEPRRNTSV